MTSDNAARDWQALCERSAVGIALLDRHLIYVQVNAAFAAINGHPIDAHPGRAWRELSAATNDQVEPLMRGVADTGEPVIGLEVETRLPSLAAYRRGFLASYFAVRRADASLGIGVNIIEITEHKREERALREAIALRDEVLAVVSHDLRSPIQSIQASATLLARPGATDEQRARHLDLIQRSASRMRWLAEDLVTDANVRAGHFAVELRPVRVDELVADGVELLQPIASERRMRIVAEHGAEHILVSCDRRRILQVFGNLIENALQHSRAGDAIVVHTEQREACAAITVTDTGAGIPPEAARLAFAGSAWAGTLGFYIAKAIVDRHGGTIEMTSEVGHGTTITFTLPLAR